MADFMNVIVSDYLGYIIALIIFISGIVHIILDYKMSADEEIEKKERIKKLFPFYISEIEFEKLLKMISEKRLKRLLTLSSEEEIKKIFNILETLEEQKDKEKFLLKLLEKKELKNESKINKLVEEL